MTFQTLAGAYKDTVFRVALNALGNPADAEDAVQEVLLKLYLELERREFASPEHARSWLIRVTLNHCKNTKRSFWRHRTVPMEEWAAAMPMEEREALLREMGQLFAQDVPDGDDDESETQ